MRLKIAFLLFLSGVCILPLLACSGGGGSTGEGPTPPTPPGDPLFKYQWHIANTGQKTFSQSAGTAGSDLTMNTAIMSHLTGNGIIVAVVDTGLEISHEDLVNNVIPGGSYNFATKTTDPSPPPTVTNGDHGTSVAGIIAAEANNGKGGSGVAPKASLKGFNPLATKQPIDFIESLGGSDRSKDADIFNMSFGEAGKKYIPLSQADENLFEKSAKELRGGKGGIYVKSAGNGYDAFELDDKSWYQCNKDSDYPDGIKSLDVTCQNAVAEEENSRPELIVVGAYNASGVKSSYSTAGATLWISTPGGEYGPASPAILTTDQSGCDRGYSRSRDRYTIDDPPGNDFETGEAGNDGKFNPGCNYTSGFNGTSSAAPNASGAIALILRGESRPDAPGCQAHPGPDRPPDRLRRSRREPSPSAASRTWRNRPGSPTRRSPDTAFTTGTASAPSTSMPRSRWPGRIRRQPWRTSSRRPTAAT